MKYAIGSPFWYTQLPLWSVIDIQTLEIRAEQVTDKNVYELVLFHGQKVFGQEMREEITVGHKATDDNTGQIIEAAMFTWTLWQSNICICVMSTLVSNAWMLQWLGGKV